MSKRQLSPDLQTLESEIIETLIAGHKEWRPDLGYPQSHSDMQGAVRGLLRMFDVKRLPVARELRNLARRIRDEAANLSPTNNVHPAPVMREWSRTIDEIATVLADRR